MGSKSKKSVSAPTGGQVLTDASIGPIDGCGNAHRERFWQEKGNQCGWNTWKRHMKKRNQPWSNHQSLLEQWRKPENSFPIWKRKQSKRPFTNLKSMSLSQINGRSTPKLLGKDTKMWPKRNLHTRLVVPANNFTSSFSRMWHLRIKRLLDNNKADHTPKTIVWAFDFKANTRKCELLAMLLLQCQWMIKISFWELTTEISGIISPPLFQQRTTRRSNQCRELHRLNKFPNATKTTYFCG